MEKEVNLRDHTVLYVSVFRLGPNILLNTQNSLNRSYSLTVRDQVSHPYTEHRDRAVITPASYSGGPEFKFQPGGRLS
jgi:hypothetical protein